MKPALFELGRPRLLTQLLTTCDCRVGGNPIPTKPTFLGITDVGRFADDVLLSETRSLPVLMISCDPWTEQPLVDASEAQDKLLGFAQVALLNDKWVTFRLTDHLGKALSCFNGSVRLYWPGLQTKSNPLDHPLYFPDRIRQHRTQGRPLESHLFRLLAGVSAFRGGEGELIRSVRAKIEADRSAQLKELRQKIREGAAEQGEFLEEFERTLQENEKFREELGNAQSRRLEFEEEMEQYKANWASFTEYMAHKDAEEPVAGGPEGEPEISSVEEALQRAEEEFSDVLVVWETAKEAAEASRFPRPQEVYRALLAIAEVGRDYFASRKQKRSMGAWERAFKRRGFDYVHTEHQLTRTMHGRDRDFKNKGRQKRMLKHLTLGGASRENCLQVYFEADDGAEKIDIGYCGVHLPYYHQRT